MRSTISLIAMLGTALLSGCVAQGTSTGSPTASHAAPATTPTGAADAERPPPATEMAAVSLDTQARLTAEGALVLLTRCEHRTRDFRRCTTGEPGTQLRSHPSVPWGPERGHVRITASSPTTFTLDSHSNSGAHFVIRRQPSGRDRRSCSGSASECETGHWTAVPGAGASLRHAW